MKHETFEHDEAANWAASSVPEHLSARSIKEPWVGALLIVVAGLPLIYPPLAWALMPAFAAILALRLGALIPWQDVPSPEPERWPSLTILLPVYREPSVIAELAVRCARSTIRRPRSCCLSKKTTTRRALPSISGRTASSSYQTESRARNRAP